MKGLATKIMQRRGTIHDKCAEELQTYLDCPRTREVHPEESQGLKELNWLLEHISAATGAADASRVYIETTATNNRMRQTAKVLAAWGPVATWLWPCGDMAMAMAAIPCRRPSSTLLGLSLVPLQTKSCRKMEASCWQHWRSSLQPCASLCCPLGIACSCWGLQTTHSCSPLY